MTSEAESVTALRDSFTLGGPSGIVEVVIVNYNAGPLLSRCVEALLKSFQVRAVVVTDNASIDRSLDAVRRLTSGGDRVVFLLNNANLGFGRACNIGYDLTQAPYVLFINPDCIAQPDSVERLINLLEQHPDMGMVGPLILNPDGSEQAGARRTTPTVGRAFIKAFGLSRLAARFSGGPGDFNLDSTVLPTEPTDVDAISGACMLVRRSAIEQVGLFDEGYFMHCEDLDWCMRFRLAGWRVVFVPDAVVMHEKGVSSRSRPIFVEWHKHRGMARYYRKFFTDRYPIVLMPIVLAGIWARFAWVALGHLARRALAGLGLRRS
jgi:GT2 family glycosyltransferase